MNKYSPYDFNQATINEIKQNGREWSLDKPYYDEFLVELPKLVQKFDLSEIITKVDYPGKHVSIFNAVGELASYAQLAKWAENAIKDEQQGENEKANNQWKAIKAVLEYAKTSGIDYCSLIRGWENNKGAAQGDQILKLLENNLQETKNHKIKSEIFSLILEEANKGEYGLYAIPSNYKNNENVKHAAAKHQEFVNDELETLAVCWATIESTEELFEDESLEEELNISHNDFTPPPEMSQYINLGNSEQLAALFSQATALANKATSTPRNYQAWQNHAGSILNNAELGEQPSTSSNTASSNRVEFNVKESINEINKLIKNYKIVISEEYINRVLETEDAEIIDQALNKPHFIKQELLIIVENLTKSLGNHYASLNFVSKSLFIESDEFQNLAEFIEDLLPILDKESKALKYEYCKVITEGTSNPLQVLGSMFGGEPLNPLKTAAETYIKWYEENFSRSENFETTGSNLNNHEVDSLGDTLQADLDLD